VALQQTTRELWAQQGPFEPYTIHGVPQQNIPAIYIKGAVWNVQSEPPRYVAQSSAPEESASGTWFPIDFNEEHVCWVEVRLQEPAGSESYWQAFRIAGEDLGLDITQGDVETHLQTTTLNTYRESVASSHSSRASTPSIPSVIRPRLLRSVDRSVRLGWLGVCPECLMAEVGKKLDYNGAMDKHTRGECVSSTEEDRKAGTLQSMPTQEG
jgi:hypothetical protein